MYESFFGLRAKPFAVLPDPRFLVETETHREALASLAYGVQEDKGFIVLTGEAGTGKTLMVRTFLERVAPDVVAAYVANPRVDLLDLFACIFAQFGIPAEPTTKGGCLLALSRWLMDRAAEGKRPVLIVDEGQCLGRDMLEEIRLLTNLETAHEKLLQVILVGQTELDVALADPGLRQLVQRVGVRHRLVSLTPEETRTYVEARLDHAGGRAGLFTRKALRWLHHYGRGIPRVTNALCDAALVIAYSRGGREVTHRAVRQAARMVAATAPARVGERWVRSTTL